MLLRRIYIMSLEHPGPGFFGALGQVGMDPSLKDLDLFVRGYAQCQIDISYEDRSWDVFVEWLRAKDYFPTIGWAPAIINEIGDGTPAFDRFKQLLFEYLEHDKPQWFIEYNLSVQHSLWWRFSFKTEGYENLKTMPKRSDIREAKHISIAEKHA